MSGPNSPQGDQAGFPLRQASPLSGAENTEGKLLDPNNGLRKRSPGPPPPLHSPGLHWESQLPSPFFCWGQPKWIGRVSATPGGCPGDAPTGGGGGMGSGGPAPPLLLLLPLLRQAGAARRGGAPRRRPRLPVLPPAGEGPLAPPSPFGPVGR